MQKLIDSKKIIQKIRKELGKQRENVDNIEDLILKKVEREAGLWEYDFDELEAEMWRRFSTLEKNCDCLTKENQFFAKRKPNSRIHKAKDRYRAISEPFVRTIIKENERFNLNKQNFINKEYIPFNLVIILAMQKIKDRLNSVEEVIQDLIKDQEELLNNNMRKKLHINEVKIGDEDE